MTRSASRRAGDVRVDPEGPRRWGWAAAFVYCAGAALRLARFNANWVVDKRFFQGLPSRRRPR